MTEGLLAGAVVAIHRCSTVLINPVSPERMASASTMLFSEGRAGIMSVTSQTAVRIKAP